MNQIILRKNNQEIIIEKTGKEYSVFINGYFHHIENSLKDVKHQIKVYQSYDFVRVK